MKYFIVVGEASGDLHASNLMQALKTEDKEADFWFFGGDFMQSAGGTLVKHYRDLAYMGFIPVLMNLRTIFQNMRICKKVIRAYRPHVIILIDYPGFNLKIARYVKEKLHIPVYYYISPKIWAWKEYRIRDIRKYVDKMFCILPFETDFYKRHNYPVEYVGNPTLDAIVRRDYADESYDTFISINHLSSKPIIALLAGSRKQEIKDNLPVMLKAVSTFKDYQLVIAGAPGIDPSYYQKFIANFPVKIVFGQTYRLLQQARVALVTSGTATLETALLGIPQVVCYKTPLKYLSSFIFEHFFSCKYISLVNLITGRTVVKELFGKYFSVRHIRVEMNLLLYDEAYRKEMMKRYEQMTKILGKPGTSERVARKIFLSVNTPN
ncbi:MAG: lipid-A-disaccharide synthase [Dysgonamonadaceae bacterium]|jgi:lipid-A-disaccharide synthase|nr:lipid-A-disaccharide synthase [Dysgonamonadaceae bacterium]